jgi:ribosomal protein L29
MKANIKKELHAKTINELREQLAKAREEMRKINLDKEMGKLKNTGEIRAKKLEIAVVRTIINEKTVAEAVKVEEAQVEEKQAKKKVEKKGGAK